MKRLTRAMLIATALMPLQTACSTPIDEAQPERASIALDGEGMIHPEIWPKLEPLPLDPVIETRIDAIMAQMTVEQKVGQIIQADSSAVTPEEVKRYRLGSVLSGGNSAPGPLPYAKAEEWLELADAYWDASTDPEGVEVAIPIIWGIDAVHGHANLLGATIFPHNVGLGAANDPDLVERIMRATAEELIVSGHDWTFAPTLAVPRDDRWGRGYEGFSENPDIVAAYSDRIVEGLQGEFGTDEFLSSGRILSSAKHFLADGGTDAGRDQGDSSISEAELRDVHGRGYLPAIGAGVQTVMISFSSWQGIKMTANKPLITDVLKGRMGFNGFVVSDWNAHGQIPGCSNTDCPEALDAGLDMFMAPDSWKGLYESTLGHVKSGRVPMSRLDDAVRRILRVKLNYGLFEKGPPSSRAGAGVTQILSGEEHAALAREAVRKSLVLLKNTDQILPLDGAGTVLVVGDGADSIAKASGGWTLSWQGGTHTNDEFPGGTSILDGIRSVVEARGGTVIFDPEGTSGADADVVIAVYGEDAYAEFQGDRTNVDFDDGSFDTANLARYRAAGMKVVSVFLSGRPLWTNPEINASDAFVAAWLPGSQGAGVADVLFRTDPSFDFTGRLSFSWPRSADQAVLNVGQPGYHPLFAYGHGLSFGDDGNLGELSEDPGIDLATSTSGDVLFSGGRVINPWSLYGIVDGAQTRMNGTTWDGGALSFSGTDRAAQEDSLRIDWERAGPLVRFGTFDTIDFSRQSNGAMELAFYVRNFGGVPVQLEVGVGCDGSSQCTDPVGVTVTGGDWQEVRISLSCFAERGAALGSLNTGLVIGSSGPASIGISEIRLAPDVDATKTCGG